MKAPELLLFGLVGWTAIGITGSLVSGVRRSDWPKARRGVRSVLIAWILYVAVLLTVSVRQPQRTIPFGLPQCFDEMCFTVLRTDVLEGYAGRGNRGERLLRVAVEVQNRSHDGPLHEELQRALLLDSHGGAWQQMRGLGGVPLTASVPAGGRVVSEPIFAVPEGAGDLHLVLTHGHWQPGRLVIGDGDSLLHRPVTMSLGK